MNEVELDVRPLPKPEKHPAIFATFDSLAVGDAVVLVNNHDPKHLRDEFETDRPGSYGWDYRERGPKQWQILITKLTSTPLPRVIGSTIVADLIEEHEAGAVWRIPVADRDLDSNVVHLAPGKSIGEHAGADLGVLIHVVAGSGVLGTEVGEVLLEAGQIVWLPPRSRRSFTGGDDGLTYLTVHRRREGLTLDIAPPRAR